MLPRDPGSSWTGQRSHPETSGTTNKKGNLQGVRGEGIETSTRRLKTQRTSGTHLSRVSDPERNLSSPHPSSRPPLVFLFTPRTVPRSPTRRHPSLKHLNDYPSRWSSTRDPLEILTLCLGPTGKVPGFVFRVKDLRTPDLHCVFSDRT